MRYRPRWISHAQTPRSELQPTIKHDHCAFVSINRNVCMVPSDGSVSCVRRMKTITDLHVSEASGSVNDQQFPNEVSTCGKETKRRCILIRTQANMACQRQWNPPTTLCNGGRINFHFASTFSHNCFFTDMSFQIIYAKRGWLHRGTEQSGTGPLHHCAENEAFNRRCEKIMCCPKYMTFHLKCTCWVCPCPREDICFYQNEWPWFALRSYLFMGFWLYAACSPITHKLLWVP